MVLCVRPFCWAVSVGGFHVFTAANASKRRTEVPINPLRIGWGFWRACRRAGPLSIRPRRGRRQAAKSMQTSLFEECRCVLEIPCSSLSTYLNFGLLFRALLGSDQMKLHRQKPRVLVVDDDSSVRLLLRRFFSDLGLHVVEAENPFAALGRMSEGPFDLATTDVQMPERTGVWLLEELRSRLPDLPVIVMTAGELQASGLRALLGTEARVLRKPFDLGELERVLREVVPHLIGDLEVSRAVVALEQPAANGRPYCYASPLVGEMLARTVGLDTGALPWRGRVHTDDVARIDAEAFRAVEGGRRFRAEYRLITIDNDIVWVLHEAPVSVDATGLPHLGPGAIVDITIRKREEEELRASEERHRFLTEHSTDMITVQSSESHFLYVSPACQALLGYEVDDLIGRSAYDLVHQDDLSRVRECHEDVLRRPYMSTVDYRIRRKDRRYIWFETTSQLVPRSDPSVPKEVISVSRDVTERKQNEERLRELAILDDLTGLYNRRGFLT